MSLTREITAKASTNDPPDWTRALSAMGRVGPRRAGIVSLTLAALTFALLYVGSEQPAYFWDWTAYFDRYKAFGALIASGSGGWLDVLLQSIRNADYNLTTVAPMAPVYRLFGGSRDAYVATIIVLYLVPAAMLAAKLTARVSRTREKPVPLWLFAAALLFWPLWLAALRGMPDVAGLIPLGGATLLVIETRFLTRASIRQGLSLGLLVWLSFLLRRWYAYADVALEAVTLLFSLSIAARATDWLSPTRTAATAFAANLLVIVTLVLLFQAPLADRILHTSYEELYAAYQRPLLDSARLFLEQTGLLVIFATLAGVIRAVLVRNMAVLFMATAATMTSALFLHTQAPSIQHILPVCFWMFPVAAFGVVGKSDRTNWRRNGVVLAILLAGFAAVLVPHADRLRRVAAPLLPQQAYLPLHLGDERPYRRLIGDLEKLLHAPEAQLAVFASSPNLSDSLLKSLAPQIGGAIIDIANVDARDGLRLAPFAARFAVVTTKPALHLPARMQQVVSLPDTLIVSGIGPGSAYHRLSGPYELDGGIEAFVYERDRPFSPDDAESLTHIMQAAYPHWMRHADKLVH